MAQQPGCLPKGPAWGLYLLAGSLHSLAALSQSPSCGVSAQTHASWSPVLWCAHMNMLPSWDPSIAGTLLFWCLWVCGWLVFCPHGNIPRGPTHTSRGLPVCGDFSSSNLPSLLRCVGGLSSPEGLSLPGHLAVFPLSSIRPQALVTPPPPPSAHVSCRCCLWQEISPVSTNSLAWSPVLLMLLGSCFSQLLQAGPDGCPLCNHAPEAQLPIL